MDTNGAIGGALAAGANAREATRLRRLREAINADRGLGYLIVTSTAFFRVPLAWGALVLLSLMGIVLFQAVVIVERVFFPWAVDLDKQTV